MSRVSPLKGDDTKRHKLALCREVQTTLNDTNDTNQKAAYLWCSLRYLRNANHASSFVNRLGSHQRPDCAVDI